MYIAWHVRMRNMVSTATVVVQHLGWPGSDEVLLRQTASTVKALERCD